MSTSKNENIRQKRTQNPVRDFEGIVNSFQLLTDFVESPNLVV